MNKTAIKNFAIWARNKLIADIQYRAGLMGITADEIKSALPQSTKETEFYDIGTAEPYSITGEAIRQRRNLVDAINQKARETNYKTAYKYIIEGVAYTWFNRLIAVRFMEINDYLPSHIRVLSSDSGKMEPDLVTNPFDADLDFNDEERQEIIRLKNNNELDNVFRLLFIRQCNELSKLLPALFERTADYTELLLNISAIDKDGVVYHLVHDISEDDFNVEKGGQVEIIGWLYQYYNTEPKNEAFAKNGKITKEEIPAVTQLFTPDWIVRYMVENSLGRLWIEGHPNDLLKSKWKYYLEEAEQEPEVQAKLDEIHREYGKLTPEDIHFIDPCMGSGHILVYAFDVLMQIYESAGYSQRDAARSILENNLYGLDIDDRAYQMAYFAVMMKARQYNRRILSADTVCHVYSIQDSNSINRSQLKYFGVGLSELEKNDAMNQITGLLDTFKDAKEYGSILNVENYNWELLRKFACDVNIEGQMTMDAVGLPQTQERMKLLIDIGETMARKYEVVVTNPPYMGAGNMTPKLTDFVRKKYKDESSDLYACCMKRGDELTKNNGFNCMVTMQSWMFITTFENFRVNTLNTKTITTLMHMQNMVMGIAFGTAVSNFRNTYINGYSATYNYIKNVDVKDGNVNPFPIKNNRFAQINARKFSQISGSPIAYWASDDFFDAFSKGKKIRDIADAKKGLTTSDDNKYLRLWQEVDVCDVNFHKQGNEELSDFKWVPINKGGQFRRWYGNNEYVVNWKMNGAELKAFDKSVIRNEDYYFREAISWNDITSGLVSFRYKLPGQIFSDAGPSIFGDHDTLMYLLALGNSKIMQEICYFLTPTIHYTVGQMSAAPVLIDEQRSITEKAEKLWQLSKVDWDCSEKSWDFLYHHLTGGETMGRLIADKYKEWEAECDNRFNQLKANEEELNRIFIEIYGLQDELTPEVEDKDVTVRKADLQRDIKSLISYAVGCMFGRYSLDAEGLAYAGGDWDAGKYTTFIPDTDNIIPITDEEYFEDDILGLFCGWLKKVYGSDTLEQNLDFIAAALGNKGSTSREIIRNYFVNDFFKDHCQTYSVTGSGKRPIYWLFDSGKQNGFKALIYLHRYNADTIGNLRVDYLHRMQRVYESEIGRMQDTIDHSTNSREVGAATKRKEKLQKQLKECRDYDEKIGHLALARTELDLDDGVKVNYRKLQTAADGKFYEVLADSKNIMVKEK